MKANHTLTAACLAILCGCTSPNRLQDGPGAQRVGAPRSAVEASTLMRVAAEPGPGAIRMPERLALPASYRLMLLDGHLALVREADGEALVQAPTSMRIVSGEIARGELAYQPALLPQELAAEVASSRESSARMDAALDAVMRRSRELSEEALALQAQSRRLEQILSAEEAKGRGPGGTGGAPRPNPSPQPGEMGTPAD